VNRHPSLAIRLVLYLVLVQIGALAMLPVSFFLLSASGLATASGVGSSWGSGHAEALVKASLRRTQEGSLSVEPTPELRRYLETAPGFRYAVLDPSSGAAAPGSSEELLAVIRSVSKAEVASMRFRLEGGDGNRIATAHLERTPAGRVIVSVDGYVADWRALPLILRSVSWEGGLLAFAPLLLGATATAYVIVRKGLGPLRTAAEKTARLDAAALAGPLPDDGIPEEIMPFVRAVNEALAKVDRNAAAQKRFLANAAHELRTPITVLCARIDSPVESTFLLDVKRDARRIKTIVEQLLSAARLSNQKDAIDQEADLCAIVLAMIMDYMPLAVASGRNIECDRPSKPVMIRCDPCALERVVVNLVENACRAEPEGGTVLVRVLDCARIEVVDHGEGVAPEHRDRIFEPFWRKGDGASAGTGLGLAIAREIVELHGGTLCVEETPGGGATFVVAFPPLVGPARSAQNYETLPNVPRMRTRPG
jgi:signal transduction histidine kinase